jgi:hypothetical protein
VEPYYADETVTLYHGDCREVADWLTADVLVTDPPYGRAAHGIDGTNRTTGRTYVGNNVAAPIVGDESTESRDSALSLWGKRPAVVFGDLRIPAPPGVKQVAVYRKPPDAGMRSTAGFRRDVEAVYLIALPAGYGGRSSVVATSARMQGGEVGAAHRYGHPHAKPVDVMEQLIAACPPGIVADPFAGGGSTLIAARNQGRRAIGVEIEERYCEAIAKRLQQDVLPILGEA